MPTEHLPQPLRALYVEDDPDLREVMSWILTGDGVDLTTCATAEEALDRFQPGMFDAVLTDIGLPHMSGVELVERILDLAPSERVVFISSHPTDRHLQRFGSNVSALAKPFTAEDLKRLTQEIRADLAH